MVGKLTEPVASDAISGFRYRALPRALGSRPRPPVENWMIIPGQCLRTPSWTQANSSGSEDEDSSGFRTWICTIVAPASKASWVDSICSSGVTGSAGLSFLRGTEPVIATAIGTGLDMTVSFGNGVTACLARDTTDGAAWARPRLRRGRDQPGNRLPFLRGSRRR
jgi:hypothetical protein